MGGQIRLPEILTQADIDAILEQHTRYGLVPVDEINNAKEFKGMCYSVDKPIPSGKIEALFRHNQEWMIEVGKRTRQEAAVAASNIAENALSELNLEAPSPGMAVNQQAFQAEIVEENHDSRSGLPMINEGIRVERNGDNQFGPNKGQTQHQKRRR
jgi:hypothetical protein